MPVRRLLLPLLALAATLAPASAAQAGLPAYVVDRANAKVYVVDTATGAKAELASGAPLSDPTGIAIEPSGSLVVSDAGYRGVIRINRTTGAQVGVNNDTDFGTPESIAVAADGKIYVGDSGSGGLLTGILDGLLFNTGGIVTVDGAGDTRVLTADGNLDEPRGLAVDGGDVLAADAVGPTPAGGIIATDASGNQSILTSGGAFANPSGIAVEAGGTLLVTDAQGASAGKVFRVTGATPSAIASGAPLVDPRGIALEPGGGALVADPGAGKLIRIAGGTAVALSTTLSEPVAVAIPADADLDAVADLDDNCPSTANAAQTDTDADTDGDACDADDDADGASDAAEAAAGTNPLVADTDGDGARDDVDNCGLVSNAGQADNDLDLIGDACDPDDDNDGLSDADETLAGTNPLDADTDGDGTGDKTDTCPLAFSIAQTDTDGDGLGNICDPTPHGDPKPDKDKVKDTAPVVEQAPAPVAPAFTPRLETPELSADAVVPQPVIAKEVGVTPKSGTVKVRKPGTSEYVTLEGGEIPVGAVVDTTKGSVVLTSALPDGSVQSASFFGGTFRVTQTKSGITDLHLTGSVPGCPRASRQLKIGKVVAVAARHKKARSAKAKRKKTRLWGDGHGRFRTHGRNAVATVRGTKWLVEEQCKGTLVKVSRGVVAVRDKRTKKTKLVRKGEQLLARR